MNFRTWVQIGLVALVLVCAIITFTGKGWRRKPINIGTSTPNLSIPDNGLPRSDEPVDVEQFFRLIFPDDQGAMDAGSFIAKNWDDSYAIMILELFQLELMSPSPREPRARLLLSLLAQGTGQLIRAQDVDAWYRWIWESDLGEHPQYAEFKATLYSALDPNFRAYFHDDPPPTIRLNEIRWGGVRRDGIPSLRNPAMIFADEATYLDDDDVVFGIKVNGDARAYPKRILAWHELFTDTIGGTPVSGVYCTLCGTMIVYQTTVNGVNHLLGTSGFLYRSNKLMYDQETSSLWSTMTGRPVVGPLADRGIELKPLPVVTTTWKQWRSLHPKTVTLSLETGHTRDYSEGAAYQEYFSTDKLMFTVPKLDLRLPNKAEVLALRFADAPDEQLAIAVDFLAATPVYHNALGDKTFVVFSDNSGANRIYETDGVQFTSWNGRDTATDRDNQKWNVTESHLSLEVGGKKLNRLPAHRAFWFGWFAAFPKTKLISNN